MKNIVEIKEELEIPGTNVILEKGDKIQILKEFGELDKALHRVIMTIIQDSSYRDDPYSQASVVAVALQNNFDISIKAQNFLKNY